jgi:hypothetical protein
MRNFHMVVLERLKDMPGDFATEPFETGWASEAQFFIRLHSMEGKENPALHAKVQISADGIEWVDRNIAFPKITRPGNYYVDVDKFGGWLRLVCETEGDCAYRVTVQLVLKE